MNSMIIVLMACFVADVVQGSKESKDKYYKTNPGEVCMADDLVIRSEQECRIALQKLGYQVSEDFWAGTRPSIPVGCSINKKMELHFNSNYGTGTGHVDLTAICRRTSYKGDTSEENKQWCCGILGQFPDLIPTQTWGSLHPSTRQEWDNRHCNIAVGGSSKSNCKELLSENELRLAELEDAVADLRKELKAFKEDMASALSFLWNLWKRMEMEMKRRK